MKKPTEQGISSSSSNKDDEGINTTKRSTATTCITGGAEYIDPKMRKSTDFKEWLSKDETKEKIKGKTVMMFVSFQFMLCVHAICCYIIFHIVCYCLGC